MIRARTGVFFRECRRAGRTACKRAAESGTGAAVSVAALFVILLTWFHG